MNPLYQFLYLQVLDILTTLAFLLHGAKEANPLVRLMLNVGPSPLVALLAVKVLAVLLAVYCMRSSRARLLARVNIFFALVVAWNMVVIILSAPGLGLII